MLRHLMGAMLVFSLSGCASLAGLGKDGSLEYRQKLAAQRARAEAVPEDEQIELPTTMEGWLESGAKAAASGEDARALWHYIEAHRRNPEHPAPILRLGYFHLSEDPEKAAALFSHALEIAPLDPVAHAGLGLARLSQARFQEARLSLERAVEIDPAFATAQDALGVVYAVQRGPNEGRGPAQRAKELNPRDARLVNNYGVSLLSNLEWSEAEGAFRTAILFDPTEPSYYNNLGLALGRQQRYVEAQVAFERFGVEQAVHNNMGYIHYLNGDLKQAIGHYELALQAEGDDRLTILRNLRTASERVAQR